MKKRMGMVYQRNAWKNVQHYNITGLYKLQSNHFFRKKRKNNFMILNGKWLYMYCLRVKMLLVFICNIY